ncbi:hypothetical protein [Streptomyces sp. 4R-3d]|uniref:hypothetical protein n=1 Tax=Streptomyces sp. 4R-3d TaxID=2559605 RepID=UPI0010719255|nr:hypothetical protein [Streptomyces sp. 4R-3d]TFI30173.1 hypothetical protein E4P36_05355 [Streptomyces sp. 4R-3d]
MDLHTWITQQVDSVEAADRRGELPHQDNCDHLPQSTSCCGSENCSCYPNTGPCDCPWPDAVLRRCEADRRILARHRIDSHISYAPACHGCGTEGHCDDPVTENLNDCPELLDLAHAHGLTPEILAGLDRPQPAKREPAEPSPLGQAVQQAWGATLVAGLRTQSVPAALRGPNWESRP